MSAAAEQSLQDKTLVLSAQNFEKTQVSPTPHTLGEARAPKLPDTDISL